jgi:hypothetical protein
MTYGLGNDRCLGVAVRLRLLLLEARTRGRKRLTNSSGKIPTEKLFRND